MTASKMGRSGSGPVEKYSSSDIGAYLWDWLRRPNCRSHFGQVQLGTPHDPSSSVDRWR